MNALVNYEGGLLFSGDFAHEVFEVDGVSDQVGLTKAARAHQRKNTDIMTGLRYVLPREVSLVAALRARARGINSGHVRALARVLRNTGKLDPILLWNETGPEGEPTGRLVLLDGEHRLAAYRTMGPKFHNQGVPALVMDGDWTAARLKVAGGNT